MSERVSRRRHRARCQLLVLLIERIAEANAPAAGGAGEPAAAPDGGRQPPKELVVPHRLVIRESTAGSPASPAVPAPRAAG